MDTLINDLKHTLRMLRRTPGFTVTAVAALALGIGANTAIFSVVNAVLLKPLPYPDPDRIVQLMGVSPQGSFAAASVPLYNVWRAQTPILQDVAAYDTGGPGINIVGGDRPEQVKGIHVSHEFFRLFGVPITLGRAFTADEDRPRGPNVVVISDGLWHRRFGADPDMIGKPISLGREAYTILGVMGPGFSFDSSPDLLLPFQADPDSTQQVLYFPVAGRLKPGIGVAAANAALGLAAQEFKRKFPNAIGPKTTFGVQPISETVVRDVKTALYILLGAVGFVLLIACANVANLQLARASVRSREIAIRAAIGAGRLRIIRQLLTESVLLAACGGLLGAIIGFAGVRALVAVNPGNIPRIGIDGAGITMDGRVLLFTLALSLLTGVIFGLFPAIQASRTDLHSTLKETGSRSGTTLRQNKSRAVLVVVEMALAIVLLVGAGLLIRTFSALHNVSPGFDANGVLTLETSLTGGRYDKTASISDLARQAEERIEAIPGVEAAAATSYLPLEGGLGLGFQIEGRPRDDSQSSGGAGWAYVTHRFFDVFKIALVRGRKFTDRDTASSPGVVIINEAFARKYWPNQNPVGQRITIGAGPVFGEPAREIVGVVADVRDAGFESGPATGNVRAAAAGSRRRDGAEQSIHAALLGGAFERRAVFALRANCRRVPTTGRHAGGAHADHEPGGGAFHGIESVQHAGVGGIRIRRHSAGVAWIVRADVVFGGTADLEFGIRLALGADRPGLRNMVVGQAMKLAITGIAIGLAAAYGLTRLMATLLYGVKATDAISVRHRGAVAGIGRAARQLPSRTHAIGIDPAIALRYE